jgi:hypothetical protein
MIFDGPSFLVLALISSSVAVKRQWAPCSRGRPTIEWHRFRLPANVPTVCTHSNYVPFSFLQSYSIYASLLGSLCRYYCQHLDNQIEWH